MKPLTSAEEATRTSSAAAFIAYFTIQDETEARRAWNELLKILLLEKESISISEDDPKASSITAISSDRSAFFTILYRTIAVGALFSTNESERSFQKLDDIRKALSPSISSAIGETTVYVGSGSAMSGSTEPKSAPSAGNNARLIPLKLSTGHHSYTYTTSDLSAVLNFLSKRFAKIDSLLHHLDITVPLYRDQATNVVEKRKKADEKIARLLNEQVIGEHSVEGIKVLENDVDHLAALYASLASDLSLTRKSRDALAQDLGHLDRLRALGYDLEEFGIENHRTALEELETATSRLDESLEDLHAAINIVGNKVELMRSRENVSLQKEALSLQVSAGFIEFIILFYYALHSWETLVTEKNLEHIPAAFQALIVLAFSGLVVGFTHEISKRYRGESHGYVRMVFFGVGAIAIMATMVFLPGLLNKSQ